MHSASRRMAIGTCQTSLRVAAQRATAASWRRASLPRIQRSGCGSSGNWCIGGSGANTTWRTCACSSSQTASAARRRTARCDGTWSTTSLTPSTTTAKSASAIGSLCTNASAWALLMPLLASSRQCTLTFACAASVRAKWPASAMSCVGTPTPAADESPTIRTRQGGPSPTMPSRAPAASGSTGARRRVATACATSSGERISLAARLTSRELREVRLALLEERAEGFLGLGTLQPLREHTAFGRDRLEDLRLGVAAQQLLGLAHGARRQRVESLGNAARVIDDFARRDHRIGDAQLHRFFGAEWLAEQQLLGCLDVADELREDEARAELRHEAQAHKGHRQARLVRHIDEVAMQQHRRADADRRTGDRGNDRLVAADQRLHEIEGRPATGLRGPLHEVFEVVARGEDARLAGDQHRANGAVGGGRAQRLGHREVHLAGDRVLLFGARYLDRREAVQRGGVNAHAISLAAFEKPCSSAAVRAHKDDWNWSRKKPKWPMRLTFTSAGAMRSMRRGALA